MAFCMACDGEFVEGVTQCPDCGLPLTDSPQDRSREVSPVVWEGGGLAALSVAQSVLTGAGIEHIAEGETLQHLEGAGQLGTGFNVPAGPVRLRVPPRKAVAARQLLAELDSTGMVDGGLEQSPPPSTEELEPRGGGRGTFLSGLAAGLLLGLIGGASFLSPKTDSPWEAVENGVTEDDTDGDGRTDSWLTYKDWMPVAGEDDLNRDGKADYWREFDSNGRLSASKSDLNYDGKPDGWDLYRDGWRTKSREDVDFDGIPDVSLRYEDELPVEVVWEARPGAPRRLILYRHGQRHKELRDTDGDGKFDWQVLFNPYEYPESEGPSP